MLFCSDAGAAGGLLSLPRCFGALFQCRCELYTETVLVEFFCGIFLPCSASFRDTHFCPPPKKNSPGAQEFPEFPLTNNIFCRGRRSSQSHTQCFFCRRARSPWTAPHQTENYLKILIPEFLLGNQITCHKNN